MAIAGVVVYIAAVVLPTAVAVSLNTPASSSVLSELGKMAALTGMSAIMLQFVLAGRLRFLTAPYGLDMVLGFHRMMGVAGGILIVSHPFLLACGRSTFGYFFTSMDVPWFIWAGRLTLILGAVHATTAVVRIVVHLQYQKWLLIHRIGAPLVILIGFIHSTVIGSDLRASASLSLWSVFFGTAMLVFINSRIVRPVGLRKNAYEVTRVKQESLTVYTLTFVPPPGGNRFEYLPGQFHFLTLLRGRGLPAEEHPFTLSSSPFQIGLLESTIKQSGDFTATIADTRPGDKAAIAGPYGRFSYMLHPGERKLVFIAGGIGITPLMSMLRHMHNADAECAVTLLYANRSMLDIVFREEIDTIAASGKPGLKVVHFLQNPPKEWDGETGYITREAVKKHCPEPGSKVFYLCGPPVMMKKITGYLRDLGVKGGAIRMERFSF